MHRREVSDPIGGRLAHVIVVATSTANIRHASNSGYVAKMNALFKSKARMLADAMQQTRELLIFVDLHSGSHGGNAKREVKSWDLLIYEEVPDGRKESPGGAWHFVALLPLIDPPRHESAATN